MSHRCMPFLLLNMGVEMVYFLEERLRKVEEEKCLRVLGDIVHAMLNQDVLVHWFRPQELCSRKTLRGIFEKIVHVSIMKLSNNSMDKLFDIITMVVKYQVEMIAYGEQLLTITLNHLDGLALIFQNNKEIMEKLNATHAMVMSSYRSCSACEYYLMRCMLLTFFQDARVKVSNLIREDKQNDEGHIVIKCEEYVIPDRCDSPGSVKYFEEGIVSRTTQFAAKPVGKRIENQDDFNLGGTERTSTLGINERISTDSQVTGGGSGHFGEEGNEMALFASLLERKNTEGGSFNLSLFYDEKEEKKFEKEVKTANVKRIDAAKTRKSLTSTLTEMDAPEKESKKKTKGDDLLSLMDEAAARPPTAKGRKTSKERPTTRSASRGGDKSQERRPSSKGKRPQTSEKK